jgi:hypothetical protein
MTVSEARRLELYEKIKQTLGAEPAATLMDILPPMNASDIATKADVEHVTYVLRGEMAELRSELRGEMAELRSELRGEMAELRSELRGEMADLRGDLRSSFADLRADFKTSNRHTIIAIVSAAVTVWLTFYVPTVI